MSNTNPMPVFNVFKHKAFVGTVSAVSMKQARIRAKGLFGRCEVIDNAGPDVGEKIAPYVDSSYTHGRTPYPVGDFEARRKVEIERYRASL